MKRSDAIKKLLPKVHYEIITREAYESGIYEERAKSLLDFIENELGMLPPDSEAVIKYYFDEETPEIEKKWEKE